MCKRWLAVLTLLVAGMTANPCRAEIVKSQTQYFYDRFGNQVGMKVTIVRVDDNRRWVLTFDKRLMGLTVKQQLALIDGQLKLGDDAKTIETVLQNLKNEQQRQAMQRVQDQQRRMMDQQRQMMNQQMQLQQQINQANQRPFQPPPVFVPPPVVPIK